MDAVLDGLVLLLFVSGGFSLAALVAVGLLWLLSPSFREEFKRDWDGE